MGSKTLLNAKQLAVLNWVAEGRPKGVYEDGYEHRVTARALQRRGLLSIRGHGRTWQASLTVDGRYYVEHGAYPPSDEPEEPQVSAHRSTHRTPPPKVVDLPAQLEDAGGVFELAAPTKADRIAYRRAADRLRASGELPRDQGVKVTGIKRGPLKIEIVTVDVPEEAEPQIPVPAQPDPGRPEIAALIADPSLLRVSEETRQRALALVQALSQECERRGWVLDAAKDQGFRISVGEFKYWCVLSEERVKRDVYTDEDVAARKYDWQRVSPTRQEVWSGRLRLEIGPTYDSHWWADRKRWTLASKLPEVFSTLAELTEAAQIKQDKLAAYHEQQVREWKEAVARAREQYLHKLNEHRAEEQAQAWTQSQRLRSYAQAVDQRAQVLQGEAHQEALDWAHQLTAQADQVDPLTDVATLRASAPDDIGAKDLDAYMPHRWTTTRPPDPPAWLPS